MSASLLLVGVGDSSTTDRSPRRLAAYARAAGLDVQRCDYGGWEGLDAFRHERIVVMPFFPYTFWNAVCEPPDDKRLYGACREVYERFRAFLFDVEAVLRARLATHQLDFFVPLEAAALDRDKLRTLEQLAQAGVPTSRVVEVRDGSDLLERITPERGVFVKCRYGAEGKGITLFRRGRWLTNYRVERGTLANHGRDGRWPFVDITGQRDLLEQLLEHDVLIEEEVIAPDTFGGRKFDARVYIANGRAVHHFVRLAASESVVTNYSQGGSVRHAPESGLPAAAIGFLGRVSECSARALGTRFAGVDVMFDRCFEAPRVLELECFADFPSMDRFDLARHLCSVFRAPRSE